MNQKKEEEDTVAMKPPPPPTVHSPVSSQQNPKKRKQSGRSVRAGLVFPVGRIHRHLKEGKYAERCSQGASIYLASVIEYLIFEMLELAGDAARDNKRKRIAARHIQLAVRNDAELAALLKRVTIPGSGRPPFVNVALVAGKKERKHFYEGKKAAAEP